MPSGQNKFQIFAIGDFGRIECCGSEEINREKERPEVTQPAWASQFKISHHRFFSVVPDPRSFSIPPGHFAHRLVTPDRHSPTTGRIAIRPYIRTCSCKMFAFFAIIIRFRIISLVAAVSRRVPVALT